MTTKVDKSHTPTPVRSSSKPFFAKTGENNFFSTGKSGMVRNSETQKSNGNSRTFLTRAGQLVELPPNMTVKEAAVLESEANAAQMKLGKGPGPKPAKDVKQPATKGEKKVPLKTAVRGRTSEKSKRSVATDGMVAAALKAVGKSRVAAFLMAKGMPTLLKGMGMLQKLKSNEKTHDSAAEKLQQSEHAVVIPPSEDQSASNASQVNMMSAQPAPIVDENKAKQKLVDSLKENTPQKVEDVDNFKDDNKAQSIGADVMTVVQGDTRAVTSTFGDIQNTPPPAPPGASPDALPGEEIAPATAAMNLGQGAIAPLEQEHTDVSNYSKEADSKLKDEGVTQEQLDMVDTGDLAEANKEKKGMEMKAKTEPAAVQDFARRQSLTVDADLKQDEKQGRDALNAKRKSGLGATAQKQKGAKSALEKKRDEVAAKINLIYKTAQDKVKKKLADLETDSMKRFDDGNVQATAEFANTVKRDISTFKAARYSGFWGEAKRVKDWWCGIDELPEVKAIFDRNRTTFVDTVNKLVATISADNKRAIQECKDELTKAKTEIKNYVDKLGPDLKGIGQRTAQEMNAKLAELDQFVNQKEQELQKKLQDKQQSAIKAIDEKIEKMKEAMSGALSKLGKLLLEAAKKFFTWALEKFGYSLAEIEGIINKGAAVLKAIFTHPIDFVKNLVRAATTGFKNFGKNFLTHLKDALFNWLTGSLEGIKLPETWDLKGIASVALQMLGISYDNIRAHLVKIIPESVVANIEKSLPILITLVKDGPMAAWEQLKEMAGDLKDSFVDAAKEWVKSMIVTKAIETIASMLIPGAGIIRAVVGIYDAIVFFIQKAKDIAQMVGSFLGSIGEIAMGNVDAAAGALESGLATALSLVINFLAKFLHLNGITEKISKAIQKIRGKVDKMMDKVAKWIAEKAKALVGKVKEGAGKLFEWWKNKLSFKDDAGESHTLSFKGEKNSAVLMIASDPQLLESFIAEKAKTATSKDAKAAIKTIREILTQLKREMKKPDEKRDNALLTTLFNSIGGKLHLIMSADAWGSEHDPVLLNYPKPQLSAYDPIFIGPHTDNWLPQENLKKYYAGQPYSAPSAPEEILGTKITDAQWNKHKIVRKYVATAQDELPYTKTKLGVDKENQIQVGLKFKYETVDKGKTPGGKKINELLKPYGFRSGKDKLDGDHVIEIQLIGPKRGNEIGNMWPLNQTINRHGLSLSNQDVELPTKSGSTENKKKLSLAAEQKKELWVMVKSTK